MDYGIILLANLFVFFIIIFKPIFIVGLDLRKWSSWLWGLYGFQSGFLSGILIGLVRADVDMDSCLIIGALFAFIALYGGAMTLRNKQVYTDTIADLESAKDTLKKLRMAKIRQERKKQEETSGKK